LSWRCWPSTGSSPHSRALLLPFYIGTIPFPISGLLSGLVNAALVWAAGKWTKSPRLAALPLWTWLLTVAVISMGGPGDDIILGGQGVLAYGALVLIVLGWCHRYGCCGGADSTADICGPLAGMVDRVAARPDATVCAYVTPSCQIFWDARMKFDRGEVAPTCTDSGPGAHQPAEPRRPAEGQCLGRAAGVAPGPRRRRPHIDEAAVAMTARGADLVELCASAARVRDAGLESAGRRGAGGRLPITYSRKVFIPVTHLCRDNCHYCTFVTVPGKLRAQGAGMYLEPDEILDIARRGAELGCKEALFTLGDRPEDRWPEAGQWLEERGYDSTLSYVRAMAIRVLEETGCCRT